MRYLAVIHKDPGSEFGAHAPDVPGTFGTGATPEAALADLAEALAAHIAFMIEEGHAPRAPRSLEEAVGDAAFRAAAEGSIVTAWVDVAAAQKGWERVTVSLDRETLRRVDGAARAVGITRSAAIDAALGLWLAQHVAPLTGDGFAAATRARSSAAPPRPSRSGKPAKSAKPPRRPAKRRPADTGSPKSGRRNRGA